LFEGLEWERSACSGCRQVSGLPTNIAFLQRLATHPAFAAAELDTGFIARHLDALTQRADPPPRVVALAAVTDHLLQVRVWVRRLYKQPLL
jgi:3-methylcrotonyl-CoA carboxylase alpha subunit